MDDRPRGNRTWQEALEAQLTDEERADAHRTRQWLFRGLVALGVVLAAWIAAVIIGFS